MRLYGLVHGEDSFKDITLPNRLKAFNFEFLLRPNVGMSEFTETVLENAKYIKENLQIFDVEAIERFLSKTDGIWSLYRQSIRKIHLQVVREFFFIIICFCYIITI